MERMNQKVGIVGLGLIGASLAKALSHRTDCTVYGLDIDRSTVEMALAEGTVAAELTDLGQLDVLIVALFPQATVECQKAGGRQGGAAVQKLRGRVYRCAPDGRQGALGLSKLHRRPV